MGETSTYGELADHLRAQGISAAAQAVGGAVGHNPISILIPCHRVVGSNGSLTGYAGGVGRKYFLLELEGADMTKAVSPEARNRFIKIHHSVNQITAYSISQYVFNTLFS